MLRPERINDFRAGVTIEAPLIFGDTQDVEGVRLWYQPIIRVLSIRDVEGTVRRISSKPAATVSTRAVRQRNRVLAAGELGTQHHEREPPILLDPHQPGQFW